MNFSAWLVKRMLIVEALYQEQHKEPLQIG